MNNGTKDRRFRLEFEFGNDTVLRLVWSRS